MKVLIAATGTGGHINPGIAIANKIKKEEPDSKILFIGTGRGLEKDLVPRANYDLETIDAYGMQRKISLDNVKKLYKTIRSVSQAEAIIKKFQPDIVMGTGGYICLPVAKAALRNQVPVILHESNAFPGMAVKLLSPKVDKVLVGFEATKERLKYKDNVVVTGTPTKLKNLHLSEAQKESLKMDLGLEEDKPFVLVFGGSQGAQSINRVMEEIIERHLNKRYQMVWATGQEQYDYLKEKFAEKGLDITCLENTKIMPYIYNMEQMMNCADLVICRSGAMTITEISKMGKPAIFIPYPYATENHQEYNARVLEKIQAANVVLDKELTAEGLNKMVYGMIKDKAELKRMGERAERHSIGNVESLIFREMKKILEKKA